MNNEIEPQLRRLERLIEHAEETGNIGLVKALTDTYVRAIRERDRTDVLHDKFLSRGAVQRLGVNIIQALSVILAEVVPDHHVEIVDRFLEALPQITSEPNTAKEQRQITYRQGG